MKIAMIGSGAAGSVFASYLNKGGADMYLVDMYKEHMDAIEKNGLVFRNEGVETVLKGFHTYASPEMLETMDMVILMVKCTQTSAVMPSVMSCIGDDTVVVSLQNGLRNKDTICEFVSEDRVLLGFGKIGTELPGPGVCVAKPEAGTNMFFGPAAPSRRSEDAGRRLEDIFIKGGCNASYEESIAPFIWKKGISNCGYNTTSAVLGLTVGAVLRTEEGSSIVRQVWREGCAVAEKMGIPGMWEALEGESELLLKGFADYYPSMAQDILNHRQTEIEHMNGAIEGFGRRCGVATPVNSLLTDMVRTIQKNYNTKK